MTDEVFGPDAVLLNRVTDAAGVLTDGEVMRLDAALREFEARFPQLFAAVYCGALPQQTGLRQFGFWLLNRAAVCELDVTRPNEHGALIVIDTHGRAAAVVLGYFLECYLDERDCQRVLEAGRRDFHRGLWAAGVCAALHEMTARLRRRAAEAAKAPARFAPPKPPVAPATPKFVRIRDGNVHAAKPAAGTPRPQGSSGKKGSPKAKSKGKSGGKKR
ncbi:MAG TPA: TPM domain-containing protein [Verrucomicrobiales bacterium]|nr:TPM domain-containing protein [Verrucomicrobiales bacterium]